ncbi:MAG TPA: FG-GAP-like repeat-containing protein [Candidatus Krumholzibacteria bacterium]|nr:FG-GAP-like repeat-containing protein [Candidatus Krumholzibacteria bacterium]HPD73145.1 FG-GAP-like repeat-containing protein [Candidatus Krumholzibacteria bacterium]HRY41977.1 FG-GAP-like repeat-containing protein [Candidatus Krumholzibacteria bacterium]
MNAKRAGRAAAIHTGKAVDLVAIAVAGVLFGSAAAGPGAAAGANAALPADPAPTERPAGVDAIWWQVVTADLARQEYAATPTASGLQAPNRADNLSTRFGENGIEVLPRTAKDEVPAWRFAWETSGIGRAGRMEAVAPVLPESTGARVTYQRDGWSEWYENTAKGLEQGFTIERPPAGEGPLRIAGRFPAGLRADARGDGAIDFIDDHGAILIRYGELHAWDAEGVDLRSELVVAGRELAIVVHDQSAAYPITIDPLMTSPAWTAEPNQASALFGCSVSTAGDVNGDGYSDVIVGAWGYNSAQGGAFVYHGSASGLSVVPNWTAVGDQATALFGYAVSTAGDVNGDGYDDVIVGAWYYDNGQSNEGRAYVYHGSASGLSPAPAWTAESDQEFANFGGAVATAGDVNGDGFADVIVGAQFFDNGEDNEGRAFVYQGSAGGLSLTADWTAESNQAGANFGISVATAGDVNGDGFGDVIVGAQGFSNGQGSEGRAFVYHGSAGGLGLAANWTAEGDQATAAFGSSVAGAGDVNGDGYGDVIVGAASFTGGQNDEGRAFVYHGGASGLAASAAWVVESNQADAHFGGAVATAGDVNGDGYADVIVGAKDFANGQFTEGRGYVYQGSVGGLATVAAWTAESDQISAQFGASVATAGDVNGDGYSDVIVGAYNYDNGQSDEGRAFVYHGAAGGLADPLDMPHWVVEGDQDLAAMGFSVATAGDVNGDGYSDVIVGARLFDEGQENAGRAFVYHGSASGLGSAPDWTAGSNQLGANFGNSVATAGDVNGDGFSDVIVGAWAFDGGQQDEGRAFVYLGSPDGLAITPAWTAESDQVYAYFGCSVATAGDVNGDGYSDVIVGAQTYDSGQEDEGAAFVYMGSAAGLATSPAWIAEGDQAQAYFGTSVATAGDVNGDGFSDVIVGADKYSADFGVEGIASVYHGSAEGLAASPAWTAAGDQAEAQFGHSVATAGDVNGDGYSDVIVGAWWYNGGQIREGRAFVYHGSSIGLASSPAWTAESDQADAFFGAAVATAGDLNGDGYSDVIVGAFGYDHFTINDGRVHVYHGSSLGLSVAPDWVTWLPPGTFQNADLGSSVATAGDVNGDGYGDVLVGAPSYTGDQGYEGLAECFLGNEGRGLDRRPRQARSDGSALIALLGESDSPASFLLEALGRSAAGRGRVRLEAEVKPSGVPFDGTGLTTGGSVDTGAPLQGIGSAVPLATLAGGLAAETLYHWRLRIAADSPFFPHTPWLTHPGNGAAEADLRTAHAAVGVADGGRPLGPLPHLDPAWPNPLRARTEIAYTLPAAGTVRLAVYDIAGRQVALLADAPQGSGRHSARWDGRDGSGRAVPAGVYLVRLESAGAVTSRKLVIVR